MNLKSESSEGAILTVAGNVVLVGLGGLVSGSAADELVRPLGFVGSLSDLLVLSLVV